MNPAQVLLEANFGALDAVVELFLLLVQQRFGLQIQERDTLQTDFYDGDQTVAAAYGQFDWSLNRWRIIAGVRYEAVPDVEELVLAPSFWVTPLLMSIMLGPKRRLLVFGHPARHRAVPWTNPLRGGLAAAGRDAAATWIPAADLSEQISTAGKEASGTGNMKFSMNGALTIGTLDGANIEIRNEVGEDNFFLFGLTVEQVKERKAGGYNPGEYYDSDKTLRRAMDQIRSGVFSRGDTQMFEPLVRALLQWDEYLVLADYRSYIKCQDQASQLYRDQNLWTRAAILNVARMGKFSSDRSIRQYCEDIWHARPVPIELAPLEI